MGKKQAVLMLVVLLLALLGGAWVVMTQLNTQSQAKTPGPEPLTVFHTTKGGEEVYSGELPIVGCRTFGSGISATAGTPPHITLMLIVEAAGTCSSNAEKPMSFEVSLGTSSTTPILDSVLINGASVPFTLREKTAQ